VLLDKGGNKYNKKILHVHLCCWINVVTNKKKKKKKLHIHLCCGINVETNNKNVLLDKRGQITRKKG